MEKEDKSIGLFNELYERARSLYNFAAMMSIHSRHTDCSRIDPDLSMTEVHTLVDIMENPGIRVTDLGRMNKKTRGAVSQLVTKLENKGYITKKVSDVHGKFLELYLTEAGQRIAREHEEFDVKALTATLNQLLEKCSIDEINHFYKVLNCYNEILQKELS